MNTEIAKNANPNNRKNFIIYALFLMSIIFFSNAISAEAINDTIHINLQTTFANNSIQAGTFNFAFNITESSNSTCLGPVVYNHSTSKATDSRGRASIYLPTIGSGGGNLSSLSFDKQYYLCYFKNDSLQDVSQLGRVPYSFRATQVNLSEIDVDSNLTLGNFNVSASSGFFSFLGSLANRITKIFAIDADISNNLSVLGNLSVGSGTLFVDNNTGRVGIGTTSPGNKLSVSYTDSATTINSVTAGFLIQNTNTTSGVLNTLMFANSGGFGSAAISVPQTQTGNAGDNLILQTKTGAGAWNANQLVLNTTGNVGINTTNPDGKLHIQGSGILLRLKDTGSLGTEFNVTGTNASITNQQTGYLAFGTSGSERVRIDSSGNVGIGTTTPNVPLQVAGDIRMNSTGYSRLNFGSGISGIAGGHPTDRTLFYDEDTHRFRNLANTVTYLTIDTAGNVGIGTTSPTAPLQISKTVSGPTDMLRIADSGGARGDWEFKMDLNRGLSLQPNVTDGSSAFFSVSNQTGTSVLFVETDSGEVGIGTTNPPMPLYISAATHDLFGQHRQSSGVGVGQEDEFQV